MKHQLPETMAALAQLAPRAGEPGVVELVRRPVPTPGKGQVLVWLRAAPINPNDLMTLDGTYEVKRSAGTIAGFEGCGTVVAGGGGLMSRFLLGREVACVADKGDGTWAEYVLADATKCAPLRAGTDPEQAAMLLTNPMTATVLLGIARKDGHRAVVQTGAAGALGTMMLRLAKRQGLAMINVVRRPEQATALRQLGAEHVVVTTEPDAEKALRDACERLSARFAFDAVGGESTGLLSRAMPRRSRILVYGMLSARPCEIDTDALVFGNLRVDGFTMYDWVAGTSMLGQLRTLRAAQARLGDDLRSVIRATKPLSDHASALDLARGATSEGKVLFACRSSARE